MIHPSAIISKSAQIDATAQIGPYCVIGDKVKIAAGTILKSHVIIDGKTTIGTNNVIHPFVTLGLVPQDLKYRGEDSVLIIGDDNVIREHVTMHLGTEDGGMITKIGNKNLFMVGVHIAHDCLIANNCIFANNATLAGHVEVADGVLIGGLSAIHQFVRIGAYAMIGGMSGVENDVIPYGLVMGERASLAGINITGMKRRNYSRDEIQVVLNFYKEVFVSVHSESFLDRAKNWVKDFAHHQTINEVAKFLQMNSKRSYCQPKSKI